MVPGLTAERVLASHSVGVGLVGELLERCKAVLDILMAKPEARVFNTPVDSVEYPGYYKLAKNPIDLGTISRKLRAGKLRSVQVSHTCQHLLNLVYTVVPSTFMYFCST